MPSPPLHPKNPERVCWGCDKYCPVDDLACGNGTIRAPHPVELFGDDWLDFVAERSAPAVQPQEVAQETGVEQKAAEARESRGPHD